MEWCKYTSKSLIIDCVQIAKAMREEAIKDKHPDELFAICRTDNNYWRHYRASPKLSIDELAMMICRDVGCDLQYCQ